MTVRTCDFTSVKFLPWLKRVEVQRYPIAMLENVKESREFNAVKRNVSEKLNYDNKQNKSG